MASDSMYLRAIIPSLPAEIAQKIRSLCTTPANEIMLENLVRLLAGGEHAADAPTSIQEQWLEKQAATKKVLSTLQPTNSEKKRSREDEPLDGSQLPKRVRLSPPPSAPSGPNDIPTGKPLFTLHALSTTSPVRKKVDITITTTTITLTNTSSRAIEATVPLASIRRAFIVPTRGKSKAHWTVVLLSSDIPEKGKATPGTTPENQQVIFGVDATTSAPLTTTSYIDPSEPAVNVSPKATETLPFLHDFLAHLHVPAIAPSTAVFRSVCAGTGKSASPDGIPGVEAYRAAKAGSLWFTREGVLWGESKPCEFWPVEDLRGAADGLRIIGSGRTCTVILTRRGAPPGEGPAEDEEMGEETEFGMVDAKEREGINEWVRSHRHLFGRAPGALPEEDSKDVKMKAVNSGPLTIRTLMEGSDSEDDDFSASVSDLDGSEQSTDGNTSDEDVGDKESGEHDSEADAEGSADDLKEEEEEEEELDPAHHPLLRPGAMPKMSKAALEMAVGIVENDLTGSSAQGRDEPEEEEEDELED
ncbi:hypothetical protein HYPSUDRAFT_186028 [Hypholoma sublateritium FD-334 SS-4]|uniref:Histone chaperone RTT106/FACT complex subunit SPT16-like middle domain-containing protein n=1 Tax=Hypholoma sublateritium (strain FD-334 SS-4) TaxID=945553 RepID=A0A0D2MGC5_HYPSF|nr:hypothetical protein HYPSUDRAFT_186028 [Hypholoma sublateritium FD-334 SS-4]